MQSGRKIFLCKKEKELIFWEADARIVGYSTVLTGMMEINPNRGETKEDAISIDATTGTLAMICLFYLTHADNPKVEMGGAGTSSQCHLSEWDNKFGRDLLGERESFSQVLILSEQLGFEHLRNLLKHIETKIFLCKKEGVLREVDARIIGYSTALKGMMEIIPNCGERKEDAIPIDATAEVFETVCQFCLFHADHPEVETRRFPKSASTSLYYLSDWDKKFGGDLLGKRELFFHVLVLSKQLGFDYLKNLLVHVFAANIITMAPADIVTLICARTDLTEEELLAAENFVDSVMDH